MPSKNNAVRALIVSFGAALVSAPAQAVLLSFDPVWSTVSVGDTFDVGIRVSGLEARGQDELVSAFDLDVLFDAAIVSASSFTFGDALGSLELDSLGDAGFSTRGLVDIWQNSFLSDGFLAATQGNSVLLGRLTFTAIGVGKSLFEFGKDPDLGQNVVGRGGASLPVITGRAIVVSVPEPATLLLLAPAALLLLGRRRSHSHRSATHS